jgi:hypothetical protein
MSDSNIRSKAKGIVRDNPLRTAPIGTEVFFQPYSVSFDIPYGLSWVNNWEFFNGMLLHVAFNDKKIHRILGSAVFVAPGIALCATHVFESFVEQLISSELSCTCWGISPKGMQIWHVRKLTIVPGTDLTILGLELASELPQDNVFYQSVITTRLPKIGEHLLLCGFVAGEHAFEVREPPGVSASGRVWVSKGVVTERYTQGRDRSMIPFPVLEVSTLALGGMSGGPVYDENGLLVGLVCSSLDTGGGEGVSYVSLLWSALTSRFEGVWPNGIYKSPTTLLEICGVGLCAIDKPDAVSAEYEENDVHTTYRIWE